MKNLKIKVNNEAESKEAQELIFELGYGWHGKGKIVSYQDKILSKDFGWLVLWNPPYLTNTVIQMGSGFEDCEEITMQELRAMVDQHQDEPYLTPECTLNNQYAEIEQVRQQTIEQTLAERQAQYGSFEDVAFVTENIMSILAQTRVNGLSDLPHTHRMALYMIASKMARIVSGDFNSIDGWHDIAGYAKLVEDAI